VPELAVYDYTTTNNADVTSANDNYWSCYLNENIHAQTVLSTVLISDGFNKTKMLGPRPVKQQQLQQDYIKEKNSSDATWMFVIKNNFVQKTSKSDMMNSYVRHCFCTYCTKNRPTGVYYISALSCHTALNCRAQQCCAQLELGSQTKSIRPRLRPKLQDQDQGRSQTGLVIRPRSQTRRPTYPKYSSV